MDIDCIKELIVDVPDFPLRGIVFELPASRTCGDLMAERRPGDVDALPAIEARGSSFGPALARKERSLGGRQSPSLVGC